MKKHSLAVLFSLCFLGCQAMEDCSTAGILSLRSVVPKEPSAISGLAFVQDDSRVIVASFSASAPLIAINSDTGTISRQIYSRIGSMYAMAVSHDDRHIALGTAGNWLYLCDTNSGALVDKWWLGDDSEACSLTFNADSSRLVAGMSDGTVRLFSPFKKETISLPAHEDIVRTVAVNGSDLVSLSDDGRACIWDFDPRVLIHQLACARNASWKSVGLSSKDENLLAFGADDGEVSLWDVRTANRAQSAKGNAYSVDAVAFSPRETVVASGAKDGGICLWDYRKMSACLCVLPKYQAAFLKFSHDGTMLAAGGYKQICIWHKKC